MAPLVNLYPSALVRPTWVARNAHPPLSASELERLSDWDHGDKVFLAIASDTLQPGGCGDFARYPSRFDVPLAVQRSDARAFNRTQRLLNYHVGPWQLAWNNALMSLVDFAMTMRVFCSDLTRRCAEALGSWGAVWCLFHRRLARAARTLPDVAFARSALNTSAAEVLRSGLAGALLVPVTALANGKVGVDEGLGQVENCSAVYAEFLEVALLLGSEARRPDGGRVQRAIWHGAAVGGGRYFRGDVLLYVLREQLGFGLAADDSDAAAAPRVLEVGVDGADCSARLLEGHPGLRWLGVDIWGSSVGDSPGAGLANGDILLRRARAKLAPWLGTERAQLIVARSTVAPSLLREASFDLVFVDADHSEEAVAADLRAWTPFVRPGGVLAGHDYCSNFPGVVEAANAALPPGATLHLAPDQVYWWTIPRESDPVGPA